MMTPYGENSICLTIVCLKKGENGITWYTTQMAKEERKMIIKYHKPLDGIGHINTSKWLVLPAMVPFLVSRALPMGGEQEWK